MVQVSVKHVQCSLAACFLQQPSIETFNEPLIMGAPHLATGHFNLKPATKSMFDVSHHQQRG
jgi:hypothetical protein